VSCRFRRAVRIGSRGRVLGRTTAPGKRKVLGQPALPAPNPDLREDFIMEPCSTNLKQNPALAPGATEEHRQTARTVANVVYDGPEAIERRLTQLDREWTAGRFIKVASGLGIFVGLGLAAFVHVAWLALPVAIGLLLLQYAVSRHSVLTWV